MEGVEDGGGGKDAHWSGGVLFGNLKTQKVVQALAAVGIRDVKVQQGADGDTIELGSLGARIEVRCGPIRLHASATLFCCQRCLSVLLFFSQFKFCFGLPYVARCCVLGVRVWT
jgi:hypothetical protein